MHALVAHHYMSGAAYPVGGANRIPETVTQVIEAHGGRVITNAPVDRILVERNQATGVQLRDGRSLRARMVVSGAGARITFGKLLPDRGQLLPATPASVAHLCLYVGLDQTDEELGLSRPNLWVYPNEDSDANVARALEEGFRAPFPVVFISFPSAKDPDFQRRHPGHATIEVATLGPWDEFKRWKDTRWHKRGDEYDQLKAALSERLLAALYEQVPQVRGRVAHHELSTPLSTRHFAGHPSGEIYGLAHDPGRFTNPRLQPKTPIRGLFLTGSDVATCGVVGAAMGGLITASAIAGVDLRAEVLRQAP
jgi:all-trans-retinol 13,14-reductase